MANTEAGGMSQHGLQRLTCWCLLSAASATGRADLSTTSGPWLDLMHAHALSPPRDAKAARNDAAQVGTYTEPTL
ncbi:hypothetical protein J1614_011368 [Plenodomus biglobosus]|nr:hypothetical protein J1614_011368 [Plenodomus biglobosus]